MAIIFGILSAFFFSLTFILNQMMAATDGNWLWTASLRFLIMIPLFAVTVGLQRSRGFYRVGQAVKNNWRSWVIWSNVGFVLFYAPLTLASTLTPAWVVASTWQLTIIAGSLLAPLLEDSAEGKRNSKLNRCEFLCFLVILFGVGIIELQQMSKHNDSLLLLIALILMLISAFSYPLGNRKIIKLNNRTSQLNTGERIWLICSFIAYIQTGVPTHSQLIMSSTVAIFSGFIATYLFFYATQLAQHNVKYLATIEATQSLEVIFTIILGIVLLRDSFPNLIKCFGIILIIIGMIFKISQVAYKTRNN